jgi:hypothetical protein
MLSFPDFQFKIFGFFTGKVLQLMYCTPDFLFFECN